MQRWIAAALVCAGPAWAAEPDIDGTELPCATAQECLAQGFTLVTTVQQDFPPNDKGRCIKVTRVLGKGDTLVLCSFISRPDIGPSVLDEQDPPHCTLDRRLTQ